MAKVKSIRSAARERRSLLAAIALPLLLAASCAEEPAGEELFDFEGLAALAPTDAIKASEHVRINRQVLFDETGASFRLFDGVERVAVRDELKRRNGNNYVWLGHVEGEPDSKVTLVIRDEVVVGTIRIGSELYEIRYGADGRQTLRWVDVGALPPDDPTQLPTPSATDTEADAPPEGDVVAEPSADTTAEVAPDDGSVIDVLIVYTATARAAEGGTTAMQALAALAVEKANQAFANSDVGAQLRLVHADEVDYQENGSFSDSLYRLRDPGDGYMDEAHTLREQYKADFVAMLTSDVQYCGIGFLMTTESTSFASYAFSVTATMCVSNHSFAHELGHNMGDAHNHENASSALHPYSYGYRYCNDADNGYRTVMSYSCSYAARVPQFSNPAVNFNGMPTGVSDYADNARSMTSVLDTIANFRVSDDGSTPPPPPPPPEAYCGDGSCDPDEDRCDCPSDCGTPPATELLCNDGDDNDCDGTVDCDDSDCSSASACNPVSCSSKSVSCTTGAQCCSGKCKGKSGKRTCR